MSAPSAPNTPMSAEEREARRDAVVKGFYRDLGALIVRTARQRYGAARTGTPDPLRMITAADDVAAAAAHERTEAVENARGAGKSWAAIADALSITPFPGTDTPAVTALKQHDPFGGLRWKCSTCGERVTEQAAPPHGEEPSTTEDGHAATCTRQAARTAGADR